MKEEICWLHLRFVSVELYLSTVFCIALKEGQNLLYSLL